MVFKSESNTLDSESNQNNTMLLAAAETIAQVGELNASNRAAICKTAIVVHVQRNDDLKPDNSNRWLMFLVEGSLGLYAGKEEVGVINAQTSEAQQPLFADKAAYQSVRTNSMAKIVKFGREQLDILLKEQQKSAISVIDVQVGELDNLIFDDIVKAITSNTVALASLSGACAKILASLNQLASIPELADVIQSDPGLSLHIVRSANKVDVGTTEPTSTIRGAITRLGVKETQNTIVDLMQQNTLVPANDIIEKRLMRYIHRTALSTAIVQVLAKEIPHLQPEVAMLVALATDIGELLIITHANRHAERFTDEQELATVVENLRVIVSAWLISEWDFPSEFALACQTARDWYRAHNGEITYTDLVTAALLIIQSEIPDTERTAIPSADNLLLARGLQQAGIDLASPGGILKAATGRLVSVQALLKAA